jgi:hypothetical protein
VRLILESGFDVCSEIRNLAVQRLADRLIHSKRYLTPSLLSSLGGLLEELRKDGLTSNT